MPCVKGDNTISVCIPSYQRAHICNSQTLTTLYDANVPAWMIHVFVANKTEYDEYMKVLDKTKYGTLHIGQKGLVQQREFIMNMYPPGHCIVFLDDDIKSIDLSMSTMFSTGNVMQFFIRAFETCLCRGAKLWGVYPVFNPFFRQPRPEIYEGLTYVVGACYGVINTPHDQHTKLTITRMNGQKEDVERSIKFFLRDGVVIRFDRIGFKTRYYGSTGGLGTFEARLQPMEDAARRLKQKYANLGDIKVKKSGMTEFRLKNIKKHSPYQV